MIITSAEAFDPTNYNTGIFSVVDKIWLLSERCFGNVYYALKVELSSSTAVSKRKLSKLTGIRSYL
jgi:hypothetical protein